MNGHLVTVDGAEHEITPEAVKALMASSTRFWLDLATEDQAEAVALLRDTFGFHPLAVEDAEHFGQRPKIDSYDDFTLLVVYGVAGQGQLVEVHCFYTESYLVTVHHDPCPDLWDLVERLKRRAGGSQPDHVMLLYRVVDALIDGYFPVLAQLDDEIDDLEDEILQRPTEQQLGRLFDMKRSLIALRKVVTPQRDMFATLLTGRDALPAVAVALDPRQSGEADALPTAFERVPEAKRAAARNSWERRVVDLLAVVHFRRAMYQALL